MPSHAGTTRLTAVDPRSGALVIEHLAQRVLDLDEVGLVGHDDIDVLVRRRVLVEKLPRLVRVPGPTRHLLGQRLDRQLLARLPPGQPPARTVRARVVRRRHTSTTDDVGPRPHRSRDYALVTDRSLDRSLASDPQVLAVVVLELGEVVMCIYGPQHLTPT